MSMQTFAKSLEAFNDMYRLPISHTPILSWAQAQYHRTGLEGTTPDTSAVHEAWQTQVGNFLNILSEELTEIDDILAMFDDDDDSYDIVDILTAVADWLGDVAVYCMSEATKYGVADYIPNIVYCDHSSYGNTYEDSERVEAAILAIKDNVEQLVSYYRDVLEGQPSAKNMAKFLSAMISRCYVEAERFGFDLYDILEIIMASNMSKLGEDGKPIYDERGKVMKGPGYWKPEPKINEYLSSYFTVVDEEDEEDFDEEDFDEEDDSAYEGDDE